MRGRGADIDADREHAELIFFAERAPGGGKENAPALGFVVGHVFLTPSFRGAAQRRARNPYPLRWGYGFRAPRFARPRNDRYSFFGKQAPIVALVIFRPHTVRRAFVLHALCIFL